MPSLLGVKCTEASPPTQGPAGTEAILLILELKGAEAMPISVKLQDSEAKPPGCVIDRHKETTSSLGLTNPEATPFFFFLGGHRSQPLCVLIQAEFNIPSSVYWIWCHDDK